MDETDALHFAAGEGDLARVIRLIADGHAVNAFDDLSWTPLHHAARHEHLEVVRVLLAAGADVNAHDDARIGDTVLKHVAQSCSLELAKILVAAGANPTIPGWMWLTAFDKSAARQRGDGPEVHRLLLETAQRRQATWPRLAEFLEKPKKRGKNKG